RSDTRWGDAASVVVVASGRLGHLARTEAIARDLLGCVRDGGAHASCLRATAQAADIIYHMGSHDLAESLRAAVEAAAGNAGAPGLSARLEVARASRAHGDGDPARCLEHLVAAVRAFEAAGDLRRACANLSNVGFCLLELGAFDEAATALERVLRRAE